MEVNYSIVEETVFKRRKLIEMGLIEVIDIRHINIISALQMIYTFKDPTKKHKYHSFEKDNTHWIDFNAEDLKKLLPEMKMSDRTLHRLISDLETFRFIKRNENNELLGIKQLCFDDNYYIYMGGFIPNNEQNEGKMTGPPSLAVRKKRSKKNNVDRAAKFGSPKNSNLLSNISENENVKNIYEIEKNDENGRAAKFGTPHYITVKLTNSPNVEFIYLIKNQKSRKFQVLEFLQTIDLEKLKESYLRKNINLIPTIEKFINFNLNKNFSQTTWINYLIKFFDSEKKKFGNGMNDLFLPIFDAENYDCEINEVDQKIIEKILNIMMPTKEDLLKHKEIVKNQKIEKRLKKQNQIDVKN